MMKNAILIAVLAASMLIIISCYAQKIEVQQKSGPSSADLGVKIDLEIRGFAFNPNAITVSRGASVVWTNKDSAVHTVVSDNGNEISSNPISKGGTYAHTFNVAGTYEYHCSIHPSMKGKVIVE